MRCRLTLRWGHNLLLRTRLSDLAVTCEGMEKHTITAADAVKGMAWAWQTLGQVGQGKLIKWAWVACGYSSHELLAVWLGSGNVCIPIQI